MLEERDEKCITSFVGTINILKSAKSNPYESAGDLRVPVCCNATVAVVVVVIVSVIRLQTFVNRRQITSQSSFDSPRGLQNCLFLPLKIGELLFGPSLLKRLRAT